MSNHQQRYPDTIILAGSGRSGTTWLGNIIAANPNVRTIFEPFDYRRVPEAACMPLRPYARSQELYPEWAEFVDNVFAGKIQNEWTTRQGNRWWATRNFVKAIRANLMLGWLDQTFQPRIVLTTRHPCAVILSRMKLDWVTHLDVFLNQPQLVADYLAPYLDLIHGAQTEIQKQAVMWSIENLIPLHQMADYNWTFCTYEEMYRHPAAEAKRVLNELGIRQTWFTKRAIRKVTMVARPESAVITGQDALTVWQQQLPTGDIAEILRIVDAFGIRLYGESVMPDLSTIPNVQSLNQTEPNL